MQPAAIYEPRTGWPAWAVLPAAVLIFAGSIGIAFLFSIAADTAGISGGGQIGPAPAGIVLAWLGGVQVGAILLTIWFAGFFSSDRAQTLALRRPVGGWKVLPLSLIPLFAATGAWTAVMMLLDPDAVAADLRPFREMMVAGGVLPVLLIIGIGAPLSEELMFRGFLFSGLAKSRLGLLGTGVLTAAGWTALHAGYSAAGLMEVFLIGLYFSWLLVRTGSLWVPIFCHAVYNTVVGLVLAFMTLPVPG
jgi:membrane protease YdiL (CAAX protease family)